MDTKRPQPTLVKREKRDFSTYAEPVAAVAEATPPEPAVVKVPVPPQAIAAQVYTTLMADAQKKLASGKIREKEMSDTVRNIVLNTIDCAVMAAGAAQAAIIRAYGEQSMDLDVRRTAEHFAQICEGTVKPILSKQPEASVLVK